MPSPGSLGWPNSPTSHCRASPRFDGEVQGSVGDPDVDDFLEATEPPVVLDRLGAPIGDPIVIRSDRGVQEVHGTEHGVAYVDIPPRSRTAVLFHLPLRELSERRIRHLIDRQRPLDRAADLSPFPPP
jgi:hypothetical protein